MCLVDFDQEVLAYYDRGEEQGRITERPSLERLRTQVLLERFLPPPPARVLDVGGGAGVYASWLTELGYQVIWSTRFRCISSRPGTATNSRPKLATLAT